MAILEVLEYPDYRLRLKAEPVDDFGEQTQRIVRDMFDTLYQSENTAGYAATQMNIQLRIVVIDLSKEKNQPLLFINPRIVSKSKETTYQLEGCLSVPAGIYEPVERSRSVTVEAQNADGEEFSVEYDGFLAKCLQHEIDHLEGILFIDYLSAQKRKQIDELIARYRRQEAYQ